MADSVRIGSNTKTMTSTVIMQLVQEGNLKLSDPISKFRPDVPNGRGITIEHLATMRSGLYSYTFDLAFNETLDKDPQKAWTPDELLKIAFSHPSNGPPGKTFDYCNTNIVLLGLVIERLTGMSARDAFQKRIFEPLRLTHTQLPAANDSSIPDPHPQGYQFLSNVATIDSYVVPSAQLPAALNGTLRPLNQTNANPSWAWTAGGGISTADDLAVYVKALVAGAADPATQKIRSTASCRRTPTTRTRRYGIGIARFGPWLIGHDGQIPGYSTVMVYDPMADNNGDHPHESGRGSCHRRGFGAANPEGCHPRAVWQLGGASRVAIPPRFLARRLAATRARRRPNSRKPAQARRVVFRRTSRWRKETRRVHRASQTSHLQKCAT
jgi:D-alanyl-D-alanine carboxypeptidase